MAHLGNPALSSSVCVHFAAENCPRTLGDAADAFSAFGDLARLDVSLCGVSGSIFATFFDIRSAERVMIEFGVDAEVVAPTALDFRTVAVSEASIKDIQSTFGGFEAFGEVSKLAAAGEEQVVEFYDMRAAQQVLLNVPGARPQIEPAPLITEGPLASPPESGTADSSDPEADGVAAPTALATPAALALASAGWLSPQAHMGLAGMHGALAGGGLYDLGHFAPSWGMLGARHHPCSSEMASMHGGSSGGRRGRNAMSADFSVGFGAGFGAAFDTSFRAGQCHMVSGGDGAQANGSGADDGTGGGKPGSTARLASNGMPAGLGKPVREKVSSRDLTKFDIVPEKVRSGSDRRTTVMIRNIPKTCSRDAFVEMLSKSQVAESCSFIYMPFDKRRDMHCGFAFVNFKSPEDVLRLYDCMQTPLWRNLGSGHAAQPAMSYARLQGQDELMKHFSLSAVMYDNDASKRPVFFAKDLHTGPLILSQETQQSGQGSPGHRQSSNQARNRAGQNGKAPKQRQQASGPGNEGWLCQYFGLDPLQVTGMPTEFPMWPCGDGMGDANEAVAAATPWMPRPPGLSGPEAYVPGKALGLAAAAVAASNGLGNGTDADKEVLSKCSVSTAFNSEEALQSNAAGA